MGGYYIPKEFIEEIIEKRKKVLNIICEEAGNKTHFKVDPYGLNLDPQELPKFLDKLNYLSDAGYLKSDMPNSHSYSLTSKGLDEVLKGFPTIDPKSPEIMNFKDFILGLGENDEEILKKLDEMQQWEDTFNRINSQINLIKAQLDQVLVKSEDDELKEIVRDVISSKSATQFVCGIFRLAIHPKTKEFLKEILGFEITANELLSLPNNIRY